MTKTSKIIFYFITLVIVLIWLKFADKSDLSYFAPLLFVITTVGFLSNDLVTKIKEKKLLKLIRDYIKEFRGYKFYIRPLRGEEIDALFEDFIILFGNDLLNKNQLKKIHNKNNNCIWVVCQELNGGNSDSQEVKIGFFEFFPVRPNYERKLRANDEDGRSLRPKDILGNRLVCERYYLGSIGILPSKTYRKGLFKGAVLKEFMEFLYKLNLETPLSIYARPITEDGKRLVDKYNFMKTDQQCLTYDCVWVLSLNKGQINYDTKGKLRS